MAGFPGWRKALLRSIGAPVTAENLRFLNAWQRAEGGSAAFNPLNTTQHAPGASSYNSVGVRNFTDPGQGVQATASTLLNGRYAPIVSGLRSGRTDALSLARAVEASPWGTGGGVLRVLGSTGAASPAAAPAVAMGSPRSIAPPAGDLQSQIMQNLGDIAMKRVSPLDSLLSLHDVLSPPFGAAAAPTVPSSPSSGANLAPPGGGWGGSYQPAMALASVGEAHGLVPTSEKRSTKMTASGNQSDHWTGSKNAYAVDLGGSVTEMDAAAKDLAQHLGISYKGGALVATVTRNGLRYQLLYRTNVGGNHFNHIHVGVKRVG